MWRSEMCTRVRIEPLPFAMSEQRVTRGAWRPRDG
jgi:hypothetical protein